ncbi:MAG: FtsX-like permease family protein [Deltaproteobacteria bacterium]|nr:FtsX-like permease family protein [Deltaproteobacteria bacterium]
MSALDRKLLRDLWRTKGQALAIVLLVACAVTTFVGSMGTWRSLLRSQSSYYDRYRFAHAFAQLRRAPESLALEVAALPGVASVETRVVADATLEVEGFNEPVTARFVSIPPSGEAKLNRFHIRVGRTIVPEGGAEVVVSEGFANAHRLLPGDALTAVIQGKRQSFRVVGVALAPEYVYEIRPGDLMPDEKHFGVVWTSREKLAAATDMKGAFNDIALMLNPDASEPEVLARVDRLFNRYGGMGAYGRKDQVSDRFLSDEIKQLKSNAVIVPSIFLGVAAFLLHVVMGRLVATQREQIATLKALGYSNFTTGMHFGRMILVILACGMGLGVAGGRWMCDAMTRMYATFYRFPSFVIELQWVEIAAAAALTLAAASLGVGGALRRVVSLPPAEAMRPEPPATYHPTLIERLGLRHVASQSVRMILRNIGRRPVRFALSSLGIGFAVAILVVGWFFNDAMDYLIDYQFRYVQRDDATVTFTQPLSHDAVLALQSMPGILRVEPFRAVPVRLRAGHKTFRTALLGLSPGGELRRVIDRRTGPMTLPQEGMVLTSKLADILGVRSGDLLTVEVMEGKRPTRQVVLSATVEELLGVSAYMSQSELNRLMLEGETVSGAFVAMDRAAHGSLYQKLMRTPKVAGVTLREAALFSFENTSAEYLLFFASILVTFATIIAAGVVYNAARVSLAERERELATLRVIGMTRGEVSFILLGELALQVLVALPVGSVLGYLLAMLTASGVDSDLYRIPVIINASTYASSMGVVVAAAVVVGLTVRRRIDRLDLVSVLKTKE